MDIHCLTTGEFQTNCYIVPLAPGGEPQAPAPGRGGKTSVLVIDPAAEPDVIIKTLDDNNFFPEYILLTHGHYDHCAALPALYLHYNQEPVIGITAGDKHYLGAASYRTHYDSFNAIGFTQFIDDLRDHPLPEAGVILNEGDTVGDFTCLLTPGHTEGSCVFYNEREQILFSGDTLFHGGFGRTDLPGGNEQKLIASLRRLFTLDGNVRVYPGHGCQTCIQDER
ncbi:MAG: MBL fold metallo-hydrolase [Spirochaetaceae bacterium]|jgi:glyoxylase-like metal-dependent hydrolase (beta-lactamase superfamily II)|nr:MBL fold metallo-hydrolase [Spirochaetaceae bacterium]